MAKTEEQKARDRQYYRDNREAIRAKQKEYYENNPDTLKQKVKRYSKSPIGRAAQLIKAARTRAAQKGVEFSLSTEWLIPKLELGICEVTGIKFSLESYSPFASSLDKVNPKGGYTPDNTQVVIKAYNYAKGCGTHEDVLKMSEALCNKV